MPPQLPPPSNQAAAQPRFVARFDPWNSSSTGHQRSSHRPGTAWRDARGQKLNDQFSRHATRGGHDHDGPDEQGQQPKRTVADLLTRPGLMKQGLDRQRQRQDVDGASGQTQDGNAPRRAIFDGVVVYVNGSTYPLVSDHRLKNLLRDNGALMSIHLGRRSVTHVILGRAAAEPGHRPGSGGGLAGGKLDREIGRTAGCAVKYVDVEWVLESIKAGIRLPEARFPAVKVAAKGQRSVYGLYSRHASSGSYEA